MFQPMCLAVLANEVLKGFDGRLDTLPVFSDLSTILHHPHLRLGGVAGSTSGARHRVLDEATAPITSPCVRQGHGAGWTRTPRR